MSFARQYQLSSVVGIMCLLASATHAQQAPPPDPARLAAAKQVLEASGSLETMLAAMKANLPAQRTASPQIPAEFWTRFEARIVKDAPQLADSIAVVYASMFTLQDLQALVLFYRSPVGRRLRERQPALAMQGAAIGQRWGMRIGAEVGASLERP